ncbi:MAG: hypothetical protein DMG40_09400 [Acidobacteria bacterium]|nr:MAG: hypothetical protein DMG40_09400 [Acidobacteriota bacterium]
MTRLAKPSGPAHSIDPTPWLSVRWAPQVVRSRDELLKEGEPVYCSKCGAQMAAGAVFCSACGQAFAVAPAPARPMNSQVVAAALPVPSAYSQTVVAAPRVEYGGF